MHLKITIKSELLPDRNLRLRAETNPPLPASEHRRLNWTATTKKEGVDRPWNVVEFNRHKFTGPEVVVTREHMGGYGHITVYCDFR